MASSSERAPCKNGHRGEALSRRTWGEGLDHLGAIYAFRAKSLSLSLSLCACCV